MNILRRSLLAAAFLTPAFSAFAAPLVMGFSQVGAESEWRTANTASIKAAAKEAGITLKFADAQQKQENQVKAIRSYIAQKVDVIAFSPVVESGWDTVLKHFRRIEGNNRLSNDFHGSDGPLLVSDPGHVDDVSRWFVQSVQQMGEPFTNDFNGVTQRGVGFYQFMNRKGKRSSAAYAYVEPLKNDPRLTVRLRAAVQRIDIEKGRAVSVTYRDASGAEHTAFSRSRCRQPR